MDEDSRMERIRFPQFFIKCLQRLHWEEKYLITSLPKIIGAASSNEFKKILESHFDHTCSHITTVVQLFELINAKESEILYHVMPQIIAEADKIIFETEYGSDLRDTALIIAVKKAVCYEITSYSRLIDFLTLMGQMGISESLITILEEQKIIDLKLSELENYFIDKITKIS